MKKRENFLNLSEEDVKQIIDACNNPSKPNKRLRRAKVNYERVIYKGGNLAG